MHRTWWPLLLVTALACSTGEQRSAAAAADAAAALTSLEERLLAAHTVRLDYKVTASGAVDVDLVGTLVIEGESITLTGQGNFAGEAAELSLEGDGTQYRFGNAEGVQTASQPVQLKEALVIGITRMGILHNLARLTGATPPDHADGGVQEWVTLNAFRVDTTSSGTVIFGMTVSGEPAGSASLEIDESGAPVRRLQNVALPHGVMHVVESYTAVTIRQ